MKRLARVPAALALPLLALLALALAPGAVLLATATLTSFKVAASVTWQYDNASTGLTNPSTNPNTFSFSATTSNGTGAAGTADLIYAAQATIAGGGNTTIDVSGGSTDFFAATITMARLKFIWVSHLTTTTATSITVGNASAPLSLFSAATTTISVRNGGVFLYGDSGATGVAVTGASTDTLKIVNADGSNSATVQILMVGSSA